MENTITENEDYSNILILKELKDMNQYNKIFYYTTDRTRTDGTIQKAKLQKIKTPKGISVKKDELIKVLESENRGANPSKKGFQIDLSNPSKINCLYRRLTDMNDSNKKCCQRDNKLPRYVDEENYMCINLKDYIAPQIRLIAKKLECKEYRVFSAIYEILKEMYFDKQK